MPEDKEDKAVKMKLERKVGQEPANWFFNGFKDFFYKLSCISTASRLAFKVPFTLQLYFVFEVNGQHQASLPAGDA